MEKQDKSDKQPPPRQASREEEAKHAAEEYAEVQRAIIEKFRRKLD